MKWIFKIFIYMLGLMSIYGQVDDNRLKAEIVIIEKKGLKDFVDSLNLKTYYIADNQFWFLDFRNSSKIKLSSLHKTRVIQKNTISYVTMINDVLIFILTNENSFPFIKKTGLYVDLSKYKQTTLSFQLSTEWILKENGEEIQIIGESVYDGK